MGRQLALLLYELINLRKFRAKDVHLIGHSLGSHVAHHASLWLRHLTKSDSRPQGMRPGRITGLDPAARLFQGHPGTHLVKEDADFVDVIHTSIVMDDGDVMDTALRRYGMSQLVGSIDFFPNNGTHPQPGCDQLICPFTHFGDCMGCSHHKAIKYFALSLVNDRSQAHWLDELVFPSLPCDLPYVPSLGTPPSSTMGMQAVNFAGRGKQCPKT